MRAGTVLALSVLMHAAVLALVARWAWRPQPASTPGPTVAVVPRADAEPIPVVVELVTLGPNAGAGPATSATRVAAVQRPGHGPEGNAPTPTAAPMPRTGTGTGTAKDWMHFRPAGMRGEASALEGLAAGGPPLPPPVRESGRVDSAPGGRGVIHDTVTTIAIDRDGAAHFHDAPDLDIHLPPLLHAFGSFTELRHGLGDMIDRWYADPYATARGGRFEDLPPDEKAVPGTCDHYGECVIAESTAQGRPPDAVLVPVLGGKLDLTGWLMRKTVGDPYASRKRALLDASLDERAAKGGAYRALQLDHSAELMRKNLGHLWATERDPVARRRALFQMWDECAEGEGPLGEAGQRARAEVIGWIRARMPGGYPPDELDELNSHRQSVQPFAP